MGTWLRHLGRTYRYGPTTALGIAGLIAIFEAFFAEGWWQAVLVNIGTALLLIPPIVVTERLILSEEVEEVRKDVEERLADLRQTGARYEDIRADLPPTAGRTVIFMGIFEKAKEQAKDTDINAEEATELFKPDSPGDRLVVLAYAQVKQNPELFPLVIEAIENSESAFEQARALDAAEAMLTKLSEAQRQQLADVINDQRSEGEEGEKKWISREGTPYRWTVSGRILNKLGHQ
jgi:hypothetical protein